MKKIIAGLAIAAGMSLYAAEGAQVFAKCVGCHGIKGEKAALGKSKIISDMTPSQIVKALNGYKDGSYGRLMKGIMKGQVTSLSKADIEAVASYIGKK